MGLFKQKVTVPVFKPDEFVTIDNEVLAQELNVSGLARQQANKELPTSDAQLTDSNEINLQAEVQNRLYEKSHCVDDYLSGISEFISKTDTRNDLEQATRLDQNLRQELTNFWAEQEPELKAEQIKYRHSKEDLEQFRQQHRINREPNYPESLAFSFGVLLAVLLLEASVNMMIFATGSDFGLLGGFASALMVAIVNVGLGYLVGQYFLRNKNSRDTLKLTMGWIGIAFFLMVVLFFNYLVGIWRRALEVNPEAPEQVFWVLLDNGTSEMMYISSVMLFIIGVLCFLGAVWKAYTMDDAYPGYGKLARKFQQQQEYLKDIKDEINEEINLKLAQHQADLTHYYTQVKGNITSLNSSERAFERYKKGFTQYQKTLETTLLYLLTLYRDINRSERTTPPPDYFLETPEAHLTDVDMDLQLEAKSQSLKADLEAFSERKPEIESRLQEVANEYLSKVNSVVIS